MRSPSSRAWPSAPLPCLEHTVYIVAIAWLYVTLLMGLAERSFVAGALTFFFYGLAPLSLVLWLFGGPRRRRDRAGRDDRAAGGEAVHAVEGHDADMPHRDAQFQVPPSADHGAPTDTQRDGGVTQDHAGSSGVDSASHERGD